MFNKKITRETIIHGIDPTKVDIDTIDIKSLYKYERSTERLLNRIEKKHSGRTRDDRTTK